LRAFLDTNVLIRHLTGRPREQARRATGLLAEAEELLLADLVVAEVVYVLESHYAVDRPAIAEIVRTILGFPPIVVIDRRLLLRAVEVYEIARVDFADAYLIASAEATGVGAVASFDRGIDRVGTVTCVEP
jgi:predicted nucleic-acid-binding protein